jgi:hypothetical protein
MKFILSFMLVASLELHAFTTSSMVDSMMSMFFGDIATLFDDNPPLDSWNDDIEDSSVPDKEDRNLTTKIVQNPFVISLASLNLTNDEYEKKAKGDGSNYDVNVTIYSNSLPISNTVTWDPTEDEHIDSDPLIVTQASQDAQVRVKMCASINSLSFMDMIMELISSMMPPSILSPEEMMEKILAFFSTHPTLVIHQLEECNGAPTNSNCEFSQEKQLVECYSTDHFAIRADKFSFKLPLYTKSAKKETLEINATEFNSSKQTDRYNFTTDDYKIEVKTTKFLPNNTEEKSLKGETTLFDGNFSDGASIGFAYDFNDTAKINLQLIDKNWAKIDENDTQNSCDGNWICGEFNTTVIPDHFTLSKVKLFNEQNKTFTYIANEGAMQAHLSLILKAMNVEDNVTQNFDFASWENPLSLTLSLANEIDSNKTEILNTNLGFSSGVKEILYSDNVTNKFLSFNYKREVNATQNPFVVEGNDVNVVASSIYGDENITGESNADQNITFLYGRTNIPRTRILGNEGNATLYYEVYCYSDANSFCNKTLLPETTNSKYNDDPRWFTNSAHLNPSFGTLGTTTQKNATKVTAEDKFKSVELKYNDSKYPYKATMQNRATPWLIYNRYNSNAQNNEFEVEFDTKTTTWAGDGSSTTVSKSSAVKQTNRRLMW